MAKRKTHDEGFGALAVADQATDDVAFVEQVTTTVFGALKRAAKFFEAASRLEVEALVTKERALGIKSVESAEQDLQCQQFLQTVNAQKKAVEQHWQVTSSVHKLHRRLTARRQIAVAALEAAQEHANNLHNTYVLREQRRAREEAERIEREERERAEAARQRELDALEAEALKAEEASEELSAREKLFVGFIADDITPSQAAYRAGYKDTTRGQRLLTYTKIIEAVEATKRAQALRQQASAVAESPLETVHVAVKPNVTKAAGSTTRTTWRAEVVDPLALIRAVISGAPGIPVDVLKVDEVKLNSYARELRELINRWPGVRAVSDTNTF